MRTIKFRAWDKERKKMFTDPKWVEFRNDINGELTAINYNRQGNVQQLEVMQFTGIYDKHGKEIYEGDVVKGGYEYQDRFCDLIEEVKFCDCYFTPFGAWLVGDGSGMLYCTSINPENVEIIGNIYESPEFLED